ncbi:MAG: hypothetical protein ACJATT_000001 [Myxococcota bacterium]
MADQEIQLVVPEHLAELVRSSRYSSPPSELGDAILAFLQGAYDSRERERRDRWEEWKYESDRGIGGALILPD